ncbi:hypothetical protein CTAYLR_002576 [Chrysophaeum taylorii]|uniref:Sulfotransferase n=1 Tax=Chrysophaeum taylorii TaxID=2483200 RepID=A0AAD7XNX1_9STRA|nr:hypothetical protein CTAYLR_002576 [Chrysophaeum taylorii]
MLVLLVLRLVASYDMEVHLDVMRSRAESLKKFLDATRASTFLQDDEPQVSSSGGKDYEVSVCPALSVAFVHVYKAAGSSGVRLMDVGCPEQRHQFCCCGCVQGVVCHTRREDIDWSRNTTITFAFVRDPLERFQSAIFELARREKPFMLDWIKKAEDEGRQAGDVVVSQLFKLKSRVDPHLMPQTYFLNDAGKAVPNLKYVAKVGPDFAEEMQALGSELFGLNPTIVASLPHLNAANNSSYRYLHDEVLSQDTRIKVYKYYAVDYAWLGGLH